MNTFTPNKSSSKYPDPLDTVNGVHEVDSSNTRPRSAPRKYLSLRAKLSFTMTILLILSFLATAFLSVRASRSALTNTLKDNLALEASLQAELTRSYLTWTRGMAIDLASAAEVNNFDEVELLSTIQNTLQRNEQIFGSTIAYEPYQFNPELYYWSPYFSRTTNGELQFAQLGNPEYDYFQWEWYTLPKARNTAVLSPPYYDEGGGEIWMVTWSVPFYNDKGEFMGVSTADIAFSQTQEIVRQIAVGEEGYAFLIDQEGTVLGIGDKGGEYETMSDRILISESSQQAAAWNTLIENMLNGKSGFEEVRDPQGKAVFVAYEPIGLETGWSLGLAYPQEELFRPATQLQNTLILVASAILLILTVALLVFTRSITVPLQQLAERAKLISHEKISLINDQLLEPIQINTRDELEELGNAFNSMTEQMLYTLSNLEKRVAERTTDLEIARQQSEKRATDLLAIGEISRLILSEKNLEALLPLITRLVSERFGFYHAGIFLLDETGQFAVLQAANSEGGRRMLERGHKLEVGESGIVGYVAKSGNSRIALDVGLDAVYFENPDLPNTRSEISLPLNVRGGTLGVLDVQSEQPGAFTENDTNTLTILADQIAIAIENARLFQQTQQALNESMAWYRQNIREGWAALSREESLIGYQQTLAGGRKLTKPIETDEIREAINSGNVLIVQPKDNNKEAYMVVPVKLRGQIIGTLKIHAPTENRAWSRDEINLANAVSDRLSLALENARLIQESQKQVIKEQTISEVTSRIGTSIDMKNVLKTAVEELGRALPGSEVMFRFESNGK